LHKTARIGGRAVIAVLLPTKHAQHRKLLATMMGGMGHTAGHHPGPRPLHVEKRRLSLGRGRLNLSGRISATGSGALPGAASVSGCASGSRAPAAAVSASRRWIACQIRATAIFLSVNSLIGFNSPNGATPANPFQISTKRLTGHSALSFVSSFWLLKANPLATPASSFVANAVMLFCSSMVNVFIIAFLSVRALAVTTSITRIRLKSKVILKKND
jgi:hypothetical protein